MIKRLIMLFLILIPLNSMAAITGDVDGNGKVETADYLKVRKHVLSSPALSGEELNKADVNGDGSVSTADYNMIRRIILSTPAPTVARTNYLEAYFLNSNDNEKFSDGRKYGDNDAFVFKTLSGKYIILDTGKPSEDENKEEVKKLIYNRLKSLQNKDTVVVDYLIISHLHNDHYGNAIDILKDANFDVKNLILKNESQGSTIYNNISKARSRETKLIETNSAEGDVLTYTLDKDVTMYLFNIKDVFQNNMDCDNKSYPYVNYVISDGNDENYVRDNGEKYVYFNGSDYLKNGSSFKFKTDSSSKQEINTAERMTSKFYMISKKSGLRCNANANSIAVVFQVKTADGNKYMYLPSDLENNGYNPFGEYDNQYGLTIHGLVSTYFPEIIKKKIDNKTYKTINLDENSRLKESNVEMVKVPAEYLTAKEISKRFKDIKGNITVYQESHHGLNNAPEALELLGINKKGAYSITTNAGNPKNSNSFLLLRSQYNLSNTTIMYIGGKYKKDNKTISKQGIKCAIRSDGSTGCIYY